MDANVWESAQAFLKFLVSAGGLSVIVIFVTQFIKDKLGWEDVYARVASAVVAVLVGVGASLVLKYELFVYMDEWWPLVVALVAAVFGGSQLLYHKLPTRNNGE